MNTVLFIVFIMMIIIFINELKNISMSLFKIFYIKDVSNINIKKYCNDIYCEAETARFKIADNSYELLSPNDIFNTKTYYFMILLLVALIYINLFYNFIEYNNIYYPLINNIDGNIVTNIIKFTPYILIVLIFILILMIIITRYVPNEKKGYLNYFNYDNIYISKEEYISSINIEKIILYTLPIIILIGFIYISTSLQFADILNYPDEDYIKGKKYKFLCIGYIIIILMFSYLILNLMNILLSFSENNNPKLDDNIILTILNSYENKIKELKEKYISIDILRKCYEETFTHVSTSTDILFTYNKTKNVYVTRTKTTALADNEKNEEILENDVFPEDTSIYDTFFNYITIIDPVIPLTKEPRDPIKILDNLTLSDLNVNDTTEIFKRLIKSSITKPNERHTKILLEILMCFSINEIKKKIKELLTLNENITDSEKYNNYTEHIQLLNIVEEINKHIIRLTPIKDEDITKLYDNIKKYTLDNNQKSLRSADSFFGINYNSFSSKEEAIKNYSVDFSYNSENTFYEKYFNVLENVDKKGYYDLEYNIGSYYIKNIKTLVYFILIMFGVAILSIILFYIPNYELIYIYTKEIILAIVILLIFVIYIMIFINFNTDYNSNVIYGVLNSSYKRDLNDLNNIIIPFIKNSKNQISSNDDKESTNYLELYIITNVLMSYIYNSNIPLENYTLITITTTETELINKEFDNIDFETHYETLGEKIFSKYYSTPPAIPPATPATPPTTLSSNAINDAKSYISNLLTESNIPTKRTNLATYIDTFINYHTYDNFESNKIYKNDLRYKLKHIIENLIIFFKSYNIKKKIIDDPDFFIDYVFFNKKTPDNKFVWNQFLLKKDFFDQYFIHTPSIVDKYSIIFKHREYHESTFVNNCIDEYLKILLHYNFNTYLRNDTITTTMKSLIDKKFRKEDPGYPTTGADIEKRKSHIDNFRNRRLFKLLLLQTSKTISIDMDDTFNVISDSEGNYGKLYPELIRGYVDKHKIKPFELSSMYHKLISNKYKKINGNNNNALMNNIKTMYYQINNKKVDYDDYDDYKYNEPIKKIIKKLDTPSEEKLYNNAQYTINNEVFNTYFINLIMIAIIYNIAIINNKIY